MQVPNRFDLQELASCDMGEWPYIYSRTAVESLNQVVIRGRRNEPDPERLHILQINPDTGQVEQETEWDLCQHDSFLLSISLVTVVLNGKECVAVSCPWCKDIKLYNAETKRVERIIRLSDIPDRKCSGPDGSLFVKLDGGGILHLDCNSLNIINRLDPGFRFCHTMCYLPEPHESLVQCRWDSHTIQAVSARDGSVKWEPKYNNYRPWRLLYYPQHDVLLVSDSDKPELRVINPADGSPLQTIHLQNSYKINEMCLCNDQIIMIQEGNNKRRILSHYRLNKLIVHGS